MVGTASSPMVTTVAPTIPVEAPSSAPTTTTEMARPPAKTPKKKTHGVEKLFGQTGTLQHHPHKHEQGYGNQGYVGHPTPDAQWQQIEKIPAKTDQTKTKGRSPIE